MKKSLFVALAASFMALVGCDTSSPVAPVTPVTPKDTTSTPAAPTVYYIKDYSIPSQEKYIKLKDASGNIMEMAMPDTMLTIYVNGKPTSSILTNKDGYTIAERTFDANGSVQAVLIYGTLRKSPEIYTTGQVYNTYTMFDMFNYGAYIATGDLKNKYQLVSADQNQLTTVCDQDMRFFDANGNLYSQGTATQTITYKKGVGMVTYTVDGKVWTVVP